MRHPILYPIHAVRVRWRVQRMLNHVAWGLLFAALVALISPMLAGMIFVVSLLLGFLRGADGAAVPAHLIDRHYHLQDRVLTAATLLHRNNLTPIEQLQIEDAAEHITVVQPRAVVPIHLPNILWLALFVLALDMAVLHSNVFRSEENAESVVQRLPIESTVLLEEIVSNTEALIHAHVDEPAIQRLPEQLEMLRKRFVQTDMEVKESLATLSEMEEAFQSAVNALQIETMEESMQELAGALELAEGTLPISRNLRQGNYSEAASELKQLNAELFESLSEPQRKAMAEQMQSLADKAEQQEHQPLHEAAQNMSDALDNNDGGQSRRAIDALAREVEKHGVRKEIANNLARQQLALAMMKTETGPGNMSGGKGIDKSEQALQTWGSGSAGNPNEGQGTDLQGMRRQEMLTGTLSELGDSITETIDSHEMASARSLVQYQEQYQRYQKIAESVLDTEPVPLGHRQVIRRYFESIRPL